MNRNPTCPHCNYEFDDDETWQYGDISTGDCDESDVKCHSCGALFRVTCVHEIKFESEVLSD